MSCGGNPPPGLFRVNITPSLLAVGRDLRGLPYNMKRKDILDRRDDVNQVYEDRTEVIWLFWNMYYSNYHRKLKFTPNWTDQFKENIPEQSFVLIKEKHFKPGELTPGVVVGVHRRKDGLISILRLKLLKVKVYWKRSPEFFYATKWLAQTIRKRSPLPCTKHQEKWSWKRGGRNPNQQKKIAHYQCTAG